MRKKLPSEVRQCIDQYGPSEQLDQCLDNWRQQVQARNWLNSFRLPESDQVFVEFHNKYLEIRRSQQ
jgi:hypothetical protein